MSRPPRDRADFLSAPPTHAAPAVAVTSAAAWAPRTIAWVVRLVAVSTVAGILLPEAHDRYGSRVPDALTDGYAFAAAVVSAAAMLLLAGALARRKRLGWALMVAVVTLGVVAHALNHAWTLTAANSAVLALLLWSRSLFTARSERPTRWAAVRVLLVTSVFSVVAGMLLAGHTAPDSSLADRFEQVLYGLVGFTPTLRFRGESSSYLTQIALASLGALSALLSFAALLAPVRKPSHLEPDDEQCLRALLDRFGGRDSLGYFALRRDKAVIFSPSGKAAVVYRVVGGVSLAAGDPVGDPEAWPHAIEAWRLEAEEHAWTPGVVGASEEAATAYARCGFDALELGDEAILDLERFSLQGRAMRTVRQAVSRVDRCGYTVDVRRQRDLSAGDLGEAVAVANALRGEEVERGFSMALGRLGDPADGEMVIARARDASGALVAVLSFVPWGDDGLSLDLMHRSRTSENGTVEFVISGVANAAQGLGVRRLSLNFAVFRSVFERGARVGAGPVLRAWHRTLLLASRWWQIESLYRANAKYYPIWKPRFVCFRRAAELPRVGVAALQAEAFIARPSLRWLAR